jgi:hypothetical protein
VAPAALVTVMLLKAGSSFWVNHRAIRVRDFNLRGLREQIRGYVRQSAAH